MAETPAPNATDDPARSGTGEADGNAGAAAGEEPTAEELQSQLEALLLIADEPVGEATLAATMAVPVARVQPELAALVDFYDRTGRGFELRSVASGWRYYTRAEHAELIRRHLLEGQQAKLSRPALETLAVVAYLQPVPRSRISAVRGVNVDGVIRTLLARELITETGSEESGATLFATTDHFLERMGLDTLDELPDLAPFLPDAGELEAELGKLATVGGQDETEQVPSPHGRTAAGEEPADPHPPDQEAVPAGDFRSGAGQSDGSGSMVDTVRAAGSDEQGSDSADSGRPDGHIPDITEAGKTP